MVKISTKVKERIATSLKRYQSILAKAQAKDINESDTVTILIDILADLFGYDKFSEITSEYAIKRTFCDLAIKLDNIPRLLIEVKSAGLDLKAQHIKQAVDYGSNSGIDWVVLTNGVYWKIYKIIFSKPIDTELVYEFSFLELSAKKEKDIEQLYLLTREAMAKTSQTNSLEEFHSYKKIFNKYMISQILLSDDIIKGVKSALKKVGATSKLDTEDLKDMIKNDIFKREVLDSAQATEASKKLTKALKGSQKAKTEHQSE